MGILFKYAIGCCKKKEILHCLQCLLGIVKGEKKGNGVKIGARRFRLSFSESF